MKRIISLTLICLMSVSFAQTKVFEKTSFKEVTSKLDPGGDFFMYMSAESLVKKMNELMEKGVGLMEEMKKQEPHNAEEIDLGAKLLQTMYKQSGVTQLSGLGVSSIRLSEKNYKTTAVLHHYKAAKRGVLWRIAGSKDCVMNGIKMMPEDTVMAYYGEVNINLAYQWMKHLINSTDNKKVIDEFNKGLTDMKQIADIDKMIASLDGEMGVTVTLNEDKILQIPSPAGMIKVAEPAMTIIIKLKDNTIPDFINQMLTAQQVPLQKSTYNQYEISTIPVPLPKEVIIDVRPSFAKVGSYFLISTTPDEIKDHIKAMTGKAKNVSQSADFVKYQAGLKLNGSQFQYFSPRIMKQLNQVLESAIKSAPEEAQSIMKSIKLDSDFFAISVIEAGDEGLVFNSRSSGGVATIALSGVAVPLVVAAGVAAPSLLKARGRARSVSSMSNLKQIAIGSIMYSGDQDGDYPTKPGIEGFKMLFKDQYIEYGDVFKNPQLSEGKPAAHTTNPKEQDVDYAYVGAGLKDNIQQVTKTPIAFEKPDQRLNGKINVAFADGHVEQIHVGNAKTCAEVVAKVVRKSNPNYAIVMKNAQAIDKNIAQ